MSWFKNPWEVNNPWAQGKPEFQKAIGQSPKADVISSNNKKDSEDVRTGYWLENNTIIFSTYIYNATSYSDRAVQVLMEKAVKLQKSFGNGTYSFEFRPNWVNKPRYDYFGTYRNNFGSNPKITKFIPEFRQSVNKEELLWITEENAIPTEYYMELFDDNPSLRANGGAHPNGDNRLESCYFGLYIKADNAHTIIHESLHPVLEHSFTTNNPIYDIYEGFFEDIKDLIEQKEKELKSPAIYIPEIEEYIRGNVTLKSKAEIIRNNIMTTQDITKNSDAAYYNLAFYLYSYLKSPNSYDGFTSGNQLVEAQITHIINKLR